MADRAFNLTLGRDESIAEAFSEKEAGKTYEYSCADEKCQAKMFLRKGITPAFFASHLQGHRENCPFASCTHSDMKPVTDIVNWFEELLCKPNLSNDRKSNKRNVSIGEYPHNAEIPHTAQALYNYQKSKELSDYIDMNANKTVLDFCISPRSSYFFELNPDKVPGLHLIIGRISFVRFFDGFIILHVSTKGQKAKQLRLKIVFAGNWCKEIYNSISSEVNNKSIVGEELCILCVLKPEQGTIPYKVKDEKRYYKFNYAGNVTVNRQFYIPNTKK